MSGPLVIRANGTSAPADSQGYEAAMTYYRDTCARLAQVNVDNRAWWYSWVSSRDIKNADIMQHLCAIETALATAEAGGQVVCTDLYVAQETVRRLRQKGMDVVFPLAERAKMMMRRCRARLANLRAMASEVRLTLGAIQMAKRQRHEGADSYDALFITIVNAKTAEHQPGDHFVDSYFGHLPYHMSKRGIKTLIIANPFNAPARIAHALERRFTPRVKLFYAWLRPTDVIRAAVGTIWNRADLSPIKSPAMRKLFAGGMARIRRHDMRTRLMEMALSRVFAANPHARVFSIYENVPWERAVYFAAHALQPNLDVIGYMHNPIYPDNTLIAAHPNERQWRPDPEWIICTGIAAREALLSFNAYDEGKLLPGCTLRLGEPVVAFHTGLVRTVLVLLSALPEMVKLLQYLDDEAKNLGEDIKLVLRAHPNRSAEDLAREAGVRVGEGTHFSICEEHHLRDALVKADGVIYRSSGAMFAAAWCGMALFHYSDDAFNVSDPLFMRPDLRYEFSKSGDLLEAIKAYNALSAEERREKGETLVRYAKDYMTPPGRESIEIFEQGMSA